MLQAHRESGQCYNFEYGVELRNDAEACFGGFAGWGYTVIGPLSSPMRFGVSVSSAVIVPCPS